MDQTDRDVLFQAAISAKRMIADLAKKRERLDAKIAALEAVVRGWETLSGRTLPDSVTDGSAEPARAKKKGEITNAILAVLRDGTPRGWEEIRDEVQQRFGWEPAKSSIFSALRRMKGTKVQNVDRGKWAIIESASGQDDPAHPPAENNVDAATRLDSLLREVRLKEQEEP